MNTELNSSAQCYGLYAENNEIIGFCGVLHFSHPSNSKIKKCSRIVILPDYQGIGLGYKFLNIVAEFYHKQGFDFLITTSARNFVYKLYSSSKWVMIRLSAKNIQKTGMMTFNKSHRNSKTASFRYLGGI